MQILRPILFILAFAIPAQHINAQALPGTPPAFVLTQERLNAMIAQCAISNIACLRDVRAIVAAARAAGLDNTQLKAVFGQVTTTLVVAARDGVIPSINAAQGTAGMRLQGEGSDEFLTMIREVEAALVAGNFSSIDLTAVAQITGITPTAPTGGVLGSPA